MNTEEIQTVSIHQEPTTSNNDSQVQSEASRYLIPEDVAIRLFQSINQLKISDAKSTTSLDGPICRICRYTTDSQEILSSPCNCTGTMGFIHTNCLRIWMRFQRSDVCEICRQKFDCPQEPRNYTQLIMTFFSRKYFWNIMKDVLNLVSVTPLVFYTVIQLVEFMELTPDDPIIKFLIVGPLMLLSTSFYFFLYFDWAITRGLHIRNIFIHWWNFGDQDIETTDDISSEISNIFGFGY